MRMLLSVLLLLGGMLQAQEYDYFPVVHVSGEEELIELVPSKAKKGEACVNPGWKNDKASLVVEFRGDKLKDDKWQKYEFSFTPKESGKVRLNFRGPYVRVKGTEKLAPIWILIDSVKIKGAEVANGDFEKDDGKGKPVGWTLNKPEQYVGEVGNKYVEVWFERSVGQDVEAKKKKKVRITFMAKSSRTEPVTN